MVTAVRVNGPSSRLRSPPIQLFQAPSLFGSPPLLRRNARHNDRESSLLVVLPKVLWGQIVSTLSRYPPYVVPCSMIPVESLECSLSSASLDTESVPPPIFQPRSMILLGVSEASLPAHQAWWGVRPVIVFVRSSPAGVCLVLRTVFSAKRPVLISLVVSGC